MAKKTFKDNPALQFISTPTEETQEDDYKTGEEIAKGMATVTLALEEAELKKAKKPPKGFKLNPLYVETKSKRLQLVIQPSLYSRVKKRAEEQGLSVNEYIHRTLDEATKGEE